MKKIITLLLVGASLSVYADNTPPMPPKMDPKCKPAMEHMRASHKQIEELIKKDDATAIGNIVIADHKYMKDFIAKNPECNPPHKPEMK